MELRLPDGVQERAVVQAAAAAGVLILPGAPWFPAEPPPYLRLSYAAANEPPRHAEACVRLAGAWHDAV